MKKVIGFAVGCAIAAASSAQESVARDWGRAPDGAFWNGRSEWFCEAPAFDFPVATNAVRYRFSVVADKLAEPLDWTAETSTESLARGWAKIPENGLVTVTCEGLDGRGQVCAKVGERVFWKTVAFKSGRQIAWKRSPGEAATRAYDNIFERASSQYFLKNGRPDPNYELNCYPSKIHSALIVTMVRYAELRPDRRDAALKLACAAADYLMAISQPADAPLAHLPPTYEGEKRVAKQYRGQNMMLYPACVGSAYLALYRATKDGRFLMAARRIADTYLKVQGADGTCYLKVWEKDGSPVNPNRAFPVSICEFLEEVYAETGDRAYREAGDRGFAFVERGPMVDWNWEGQFEDVEPSSKYQNLTEHPACDTALYLLKRFPGDRRRLAQARELVRWAEDQFVAWEKPCRPDGKGFRSFGQRTGFSPVRPWDVNLSGWQCPSVMEQYSFYIPIDASAAKMVRSYLALYRADGDSIHLEKARALGASMVAMQKNDGGIPTHWVTIGSWTPWLNCLAASANALAELSEFPLR